MTNRDTIILLHGTSQSATTFSKAFLSSSGLPSLFPSLKWVFPCGATRKTTVLGRESYAWFDLHSFADRTLGEDDSLIGLKESAVYLAGVVKQEVDLLKHQRGGKVLFGGFSQGCAMSLILLLSGELERLGIRMGDEVAGFVGLSGWLPFRKQLACFNGTSAVTYTRELLGFEELGQGVELTWKIPVWLGNGELDEKVKPQWGREMRDVLLGLGMKVQLCTYEMGHWWCEEEMVDLECALRGMIEPTSVE